MRHATITLHAAAPDKPAEGAACNGCGVCCAAELCPAAQLRFWRRRGPCPALEWIENDRLYRCGLLVSPQRHFGGLPRALQLAAAHWCRRAIAAGRGCDSDARLSD